MGKTMPIIIIDGWEVSIRDCEFQNFISLVKGEKRRVSYPEQRTICEFLTKRRYTLTEIIDFPDYAYSRLTEQWRSELRIIAYQLFFASNVGSLETVDCEEFIRFILQTARDTKFKEEVITYLDNLAKEIFGLTR